MRNLRRRADERSRRELMVDEESVDVVVILMRR